MSVRYIRVNAEVDLFAAATRAFGNIAIIGQAPDGPTNDPQLFTSPGEARETFGATDSALSRSINIAFRQTPGPTIVYGVRTAGVTVQDWQASLDVVSGINAQFVVLADTPADEANTNMPGDQTELPGAIVQLSNHVRTVSETGSDGMERMGVAMLPNGVADPAAISGVTSLVNDRMIYIAHRSSEDAAAAVAGTVAGYDPHISALLKPVNINTNFFTPSQIATLNGVEAFRDGPAGQGVNWLTDPILIPGRGVYMGEGYTGNPGGMKFIDITRTVDDISFKTKARLIRSIGSLRISRSGLRSLIGQIEAVLDAELDREVIEGYDINIPLLALLDKDPSALTDSELQRINDAQNNRVVEVLVAVDYAGAIHRLAITLRFE